MGKEKGVLGAIGCSNGVTAAMILVESSGASDIGRRRSVNEDAVFLDDELGLYVVADGMGGHQAGEVASRLVVETIRDTIKEFLAVDCIDTLEGYDGKFSPSANKLRASIFRANRVVNQLSSQDGDYQRMGSTVSAALFTDETLIVANVGDSPIWLVHNGTMELLSIPHTVMAEQAKLKPGSETDLAPGIRHLLTRAMGIEAGVTADVCELPCFEGDILVMASDGLSNLVSTGEILDIVTRERPAEACRLLTNLANERGGEDNITVVVARVVSVQSRRCSVLRRLRRWFGNRA